MTAISLVFSASSFEICPQFFVTRKFPSVLNQEVPATHMPSEVHELNWQIKQLSENMRKAMEELCPNIDFPIEV